MGKRFILLGSAKDGANDFTIYLRHKHRTVDPDDPEWNKETTWTVNETVHYVDNQGKTLPGYQCDVDVPP
ncbi:hypothetical protein BIY40_02315 [Pediococcus acidilactici]|nr:hypothetical protein BIY40_02315 [Pediococcus acidilactici]